VEATASKSTENLTKAEGLWATKVDLYLLWLEYLALSPSYELARRFRAGTITDGEMAVLPSDFEKVLSVYDDLGDVQRVLFRIWWLETGIRFFGSQGSAPRVRRIVTLVPGKNRTKVASQNMENYVSITWPEYGKQPTLVAAIPIGMPKAKVLKAVAAMLDKYPAEERVLRTEPKYPLLGKRQNRNSLFAYLSVVVLRSAMRKQQLWRVGARSKISFSYSRSVDPEAQVEHGGQGAHERILLTILTSRALLRGRMIAENAARGIFPSYATLPEAMDFDLPKLYKLITRRRKWQTAEKLRIAEKARAIEAAAAEQDIAD
jgi:hypothetical protein